MYLLERLMTTRPRMYIACMCWIESESEGMRQRMKKVETKNRKIDGVKWVKGRTAEIKT